MTLEGLLITLAVGAIAGWLAGVLMKGSGFGLVANIVIGIIGAFVGGYLLGMLGVSLGGGIIAGILNASHQIDHLILSVKTQLDAGFFIYQV